MNSAPFQRSHQELMRLLWRLHERGAGDWVTFYAHVNRVKHVGDIDFNRLLSPADRAGRVENEVPFNRLEAVAALIPRVDASDIRKLLDGFHDEDNVTKHNRRVSENQTRKSVSCYPGPGGGTMDFKLVIQLHARPISVCRGSIRSPISGRHWITVIGDDQVTVSALAKAIEEHFSLMAPKAVFVRCRFDPSRLNCWISGSDQAQTGTLLVRFGKAPLSTEEDEIAMAPGDHQASSSAPGTTMNAGQLLVDPNADRDVAWRDIATQVYRHLVLQT